ncbi:MAG: 4Fe-4S binding protein [Candidatus Thorarchaeota archaeon SMTZ1-83]
MNEECCSGCGNCVKVCRYGVYEKLDEKPQVAHIMYCKECGECMEECPDGCIRFRE